VEIERRVWDEGVCLVWATTAGDCVAFYRSEADLPKIPPGFVPYSDAELLHLFGREQLFRIRAASVPCPYLPKPPLPSK
jgi:hypothetical protein